VDALVNRAEELHQALIDFVLDAEGDLAIALETYSADTLKHFANTSLINSQQQQWAIALFLLEGQTESGSPLERFIAQLDSAEGDRALLQSWAASVIGVFAVQTASDDQLTVMNWLTAKHYSVALKNLTEQTQLARLKPGDILVTRISPVGDNLWVLSSPFTLLGKLGKPKLAVAIGNFRKTFPAYLYSDAPELLAEAWISVERYHQSFLDFFGADEVTLPGVELGKQLAEFQQQLTQEKFQAAGLDPSKSLQELAEDAGVSTDELTEEIATATGMDASVVLNQTAKPQMNVPQIELPNELKRAEAVTVLTHPRWGQHFLSDYSRLKQLLESKEETAQAEASQLVRRYVEKPEISPLALYRLADQHPKPIEALLQTYLEQPKLSLPSALEVALQKADKPLEPELPETASVPLHLHELFQAAIAEVKPEKQKAKSGRKAAAGFKR
jgi:hypothetical protein